MCVSGWVLLKSSDVLQRVHTSRIQAQHCKGFAVMYISPVDTSINVNLCVHNHSAHADPPLLVPLPVRIYENQVCDLIIKNAAVRSCFLSDSTYTRDAIIICFIRVKLVLR